MGGRREPVRELTVPDERVAVDAHPVRFRELDQPIRLPETPIALSWVHRHPLHGVLGRDCVELAREGMGVALVPD
jgi:hypothetical protein